MGRSSVQVQPTMRSHALLNVARHFQHVAHDGTSRGTRAGALAEEHGLAHEVAHHVNGVEHAVHGGQLVVRRDHGGMHAYIDPIARRWAMARSLMT